jgi:hypothetical protein
LGLAEYVSFPFVNDVSLERLARIKCITMTHSLDLFVKSVLIQMGRNPPPSKSRIEELVVMRLRNLIDDGVYYSLLLAISVI